MWLDILYYTAWVLGIITAIIAFWGTFIIVAAFIYELKTGETLGETKEEREKRIEGYKEYLRRRKIEKEKKKLRKEIRRDASRAYYRRMAPYTSGLCSS